MHSLLKNAMAQAISEFPGLHVHIPLFHFHLSIELQHGQHPPIILSTLAIISLGGLFNVNLIDISDVISYRHLCKLSRMGRPFAGKHGSHSSFRFDSGEADF